jgi:hypothetical protein
VEKERKEMTCEKCKQAIEKTLLGEHGMRLIYFRVEEADMVMVGCVEHVATGLKRYRLGMELERQHGGEEKK